jgi:hypothetical protein
MQVVATILWMGGVFVASVVLTALVMRTVHKRPARKRVNLGERGLYQLGGFGE